MFGTSEEEASDFDHSEDTENPEEIGKLRQESQALNNIRQSMGSEHLARKVFDKVFTDDIKRLRSMENMWKSRKPPEALVFDELLKEALHMNASIAQYDQKVWTKVENFTVFCDR